MEKCHILFPGAFKPVHAGHAALIEKYLNSGDYDVDVTVVISKSPREGITAQSSEWFLKKVFRNSRKVKIMISEAPSPIGQVYNMIGEKAYGDGIYAMGASSKTGDIDRAEKCAKAFSNNGKYYTEGVEVILFPRIFRQYPYGVNQDLAIERSRHHCRAVTFGCLPTRPV